MLRVALGSCVSLYFPTQRSPRPELRDEVCVAAPALENCRFWDRLVQAWADLETSPARPPDLMGGKGAAGLSLKRTRLDF